VLGFRGSGLSEEIERREEGVGFEEMRESDFIYAT